jgi:ubiquinone biosynthesis protein
MAGTIAALYRLAAAGFVLAREGGFSLVDTQSLPTLPRAAIRAARLIEKRDDDAVARPERLTAALNRLGPSYVKLGQFLATRPDIVGREASETLGRLRDEMEPFPEAQARAAIEKALHRPVGELFRSFSSPIAAASIAQVHKAEIVGPDGEDRPVAVKILRPVVCRFYIDGELESARLIDGHGPQYDKKIEDRIIGQPLSELEPKTIRASFESEDQ